MSAGYERKQRRPVAIPLAALNARVDDWNQQYPIGTTVTVQRDNGNVLHTQTRSQAWVLSGHTAVIMVNGIAGGYDLDRVRPHYEDGQWPTG